MADTERSVKVNIQIVTNQAKTALDDITKATDSAKASLSNLGSGATQGANVIGDATKNAQSSLSGFFSATVAGVAIGNAAWDALKKSAEVTFDFIKDSLRESAEASQIMVQVKTNVENAGLSYDKLSNSIESYSKNNLKLGFDDEATALSVSKLTLVTGDYEKALKLNQLAMDLSRSKNIDLATATTLVTQVTEGHNRALIPYGITLGDTASAADNLAALQEKVKNSAVNFAETASGKLATMKEQWHNVQQEIGDKLMPTVTEVLSFIVKWMPIVVQDVEDFGSGVVAVAKFFMTWTPLGATFQMVANGIHMIVDEWDLLTGRLQSNANATMQITPALQAVIDKYNELHPKAQITDDDFKQMSSTMQIRLIDTYKKAANAANDLTTGFQGVGTGAKATQQELDAAKKKLDELNNSIVQVTSKTSEFTFESVADFKRFASLLEDTKLAQDQWVKSSMQGFDAFTSKIKSTNSEIDSLKGKLENARQAFADFVSSTTKSSGDSFAQIVHDAEKAIPGLTQQLTEAQKKLRDAQNQGQDTASEQKTVSDLQKQLDDKNSIITSSQKQQYQTNQEFLTELAFLRSQDGKNELDQAYAVMQQKIEIKTKEYELEASQIADQIANKVKERDAYIAAQAAMSKAFDENVKLRQKSSTAEIASLNQLEKAVNAAADAYIRLASVNKGGSVIPTGLTGKASGGPVNAGQTYLVGENGPELFTSSVSGSIIPNDKVSSAMGGTTINIVNPSVRSDQDIHEIISQVEEALSRRDELARMGAYK